MSINTIKVFEDTARRSRTNFSDNSSISHFSESTIRKELKSELFLVQLIEFEEETKQINHFATYADGIGPWYKQILDKKEKGKWKFTSLVKDAHALGLKVHPYTFRADQLEEFSSFEEMMQVLFFEANIDGGFTDFPDKMVAFLAKK